MNLYDIMNKKHKQAPVVESVEAVESAEPFTPTHAVMDSEAIASVAPPVQEAPQAVQKMPYTWWWQTPEYLSAVESSEKVAAKQYEQDKKRLRRERNVAILGDLAKLAAQTGAVAGGAWKVDAFAPETQKVNDKFAALRERRAADVAAFAKQRAAARQALIADNNARMKLETSLAEADIDRKIKAATEKTNQEFRERTLKNEEKRIEIAKQNADTAAQNAKTRQDGSGIRVFMPNGDSKIYNNIYRANEEAKRAGMPKCMKTVTVRDEYGRSTTKEVEETSPQKLKAWIEKWSYNNELGGGNIQGWDDSGINEELIDEDFK